ncbi:ankyrin repeat domain-containing protein [Parashewanella spongiae]|uniref:Ankyrin repeat domain-containing protein n=1 Tax=Parashewanella spongiae TaxID=342950 RepID=A0A3A6UB91_9GAMM|nr:ankyrin repeat domain-containing protein [Parashewanella spongiae]MCL1076812.1 ankyrin repeat domain-containing protein [Parashewanella spongiae]RJY19264.1 ankyrin repeat domain-containing protein [Parashewanella spongiae]
MAVESIEMTKIESEAVSFEEQEPAEAENASLGKYSTEFEPLISLVNKIIDPKLALDNLKQTLTQLETGELEFSVKHLEQVDSQVFSLNLNTLINILQSQDLNDSDRVIILAHIRYRHDENDNNLKINLMHATLVAHIIQADLFQDYLPVITRIVADESQRFLEGLELKTASLMVAMKQLRESISADFCLETVSIRKQDEVLKQSQLDDFRKQVLHQLDINEVIIRLSIDWARYIMDTQAPSTLNGMKNVKMFSITEKRAAYASTDQKLFDLMGDSSPLYAMLSMGRSKNRNVSMHEAGLVDALHNSIAILMYGKEKELQNVCNLLNDEGYIATHANLYFITMKAGNEKKVTSLLDLTQVENGAGISQLTLIRMCQHAIAHSPSIQELMGFLEGGLTNLGEITEVFQNQISRAIEQKVLKLSVAEKIAAKADKKDETSVVECFFVGLEVVEEGIVKQLLSPRLKNKLLEYVVKTNEPKKMMQLVAYGVSINEVCCGMSLLTYIINTGNSEAINFALGFEGADLESLDEKGNNCLHLAVTAGNIEAVKAILGKKVSLGLEVNAEGMAPLHLAVFEQKCECVKTLLACKELKIQQETTLELEVNGKNRHYVTPFTMAYFKKDNELIDVLLDELIERKLVDKPSATNSSPFCLLIRGGYESRVERIVNGLTKAELNDYKVPENGGNYLFEAVEFKQQGTFNILFQQNKLDINCVDSFGCTLLHRCAEKGELNSFKTLLKNDLSLTAITALQSTPLLIAARYGHIAIVKAILFHSLGTLNNPREDGMTPFMIAAENGHLDIVKLLSEHQVEFNSALPTTNENALHLAIKNGHCALVEFLFTLPIKIKNCMIDGKELNLSDIAVMNNQTEMISLLFSKEKFVCETWHLNFILEHGNRKALQRYLLRLDIEQCKALINVTRPDVDSPICVAIMAGKTDCLATLLERGGNTESRFYFPHRLNPARVARADRGAQKAVDVSQNGQWLTPLHIAIDERSITATKCLLSYGAKVNARTDHNETLQDFCPTALYLSVARQYYEIVDELLKYNAATNLKYQHTALSGRVKRHTVKDLAKNMGLSDIVKKVK